MYSGGITFSINKSFGRLQLIPEPQGIRFYYVPIVDGQENPKALGFLDLLVPLDAVGGLWATTRAFLYQVESLDESIILQGGAIDTSHKVGAEDPEAADALIKLYRDKPRGQQGKLSGEETCWLRIVTGRSEEERRRIKLGPRDLMCVELACTAVLALAGQAGSHKPELAG